MTVKKYWWSEDKITLVVKRIRLTCRNVPGILFNNAVIMLASTMALIVGACTIDCPNTPGPGVSNLVALRWNTDVVSHTKACMAPSELDGMGPP